MTLVQYITALINTMKDCDSNAYARMCHVIGTRTARVQLDSDAVIVCMQHGVLIVDQVTEELAVDGEGVTDSGTVLALLRGDVEVSEAILNDSLRVYGEVDQIDRMFQAIEILLDAAPRCPALQKLSAQFVEEAQPVTAAVVSRYPRAGWYPFVVDSREQELLIKYGLLPP